MLPNTFVQNKKKFLAYNEFRKEIFSALAPRDSEFVLYLLPWLLSVNDAAVPGYLPDLETPLAVFGAATDQRLLKRESTFKTRFDIRRPGPLLKPAHRAALIQGIYTIGSIGTIGQTPSSDCDIWICIDAGQFDDQARNDLARKINLVKDWLDAHLKLPIYFFLCDVEDIRQGRFGSLDDESSGSAQRNVLKEEFYRTAILISGKIPLWWAAFDPAGETNYEALAAQYQKGVFGDYDFIDLGTIATIDQDEYFGATLWQFNKALTHPLKSVIKMLLLEMLLQSPGEALLCNRFRKLILQLPPEAAFCDPGVFAGQAVLDFQKSADPRTFSFIQQCFYLRHEIKLFTKQETVKEKLARPWFQHHRLSREEIYRLNDFATWPMGEQLEFGEKILRLLSTIYRKITDRREEITSGLTRRDMTIIGRKLTVCLERREGKVPLIHKPTAQLNHPNLTFRHRPPEWQVLSGGEAGREVIAGADIVSCIAYLVWNDLYRSLDVRMAPNPTPVTLQEIHNLAKRIGEVFGTFDITGIDFKHFLEPEKVTTVLVIVSFAGSATLKEMNDFSILYENHWGELFFRHVTTLKAFKTFIDDRRQKFAGAQMHYYVRRSSLYYEKIIERTKMLVTHIFDESL